MNPHIFTPFCNKKRKKYAKQLHGSWKMPIFAFRMSSIPSKGC